LNQKSQYWVLLVVTNKNHGQPLIQDAISGEPFLTGASYHPAPEEVPFKKNSPEMIGFLATSSYVDPVGFWHDGKIFLFPPEKAQDVS
jgi:hypothetical protein